MGISDNADQGIQSMIKKISKDVINENKEKIKKEISKNGGDACIGIDKMANEGIPVDLSSAPKELIELANNTSSIMKNYDIDTTCTGDCRYEQQLAIKKGQMTAMERLYELVPSFLRSTQKDYYNFKRDTTYEDYQKDNVNAILGDRINDIERKFATYSSILKKIDSEGDPVQKETMIQYLNDLENKYEREYEELENTNIKDREKFKIADRNNVYHEIEINSFQKYNFLLFIVLIVCIIIYLLIFLYVFQEYKTIDLIIRRVQIVMPLLILYGLVVGIYIYISETSIIPSFRPFLSNDRTTSRNVSGDENTKDVSNDRDRSFCIGLTKSSS